MGDSPGFHSWSSPFSHLYVDRSFSLFYLNNLAVILFARDTNFSLTETLATIVYKYC